METAGLTVLMRAGVPAVHVHTHTNTCIYTRGILKRQVSRYDSRVDLARATVLGVVEGACVLKEGRGEAKDVHRHRMAADASLRLHRWGPRAPAKSGRSWRDARGQRRLPGHERAWSEGPYRAGVEYACRRGGYVP